MNTQSYANHVYRPQASVAAGLFAVVGFAAAVVLALQDTSWLLSLTVVSLALAVMMLVVMSRTYTVRLQNRIVRLEMQLRLERLGRGQDVSRLSLPQLVGLRFASDAELPALVDRAIAERLTSGQIKQAIADWQGDYLRT